MPQSFFSDASSAKWTVNGQDVVTVDASGEVSAKLGGTLQPINNIASIGIGQTWQDVTASRALSVTYTNTTGRPIVVNFNAYNASAGGRIRVFLNNSIIALIGTGTSGDYPYVNYTLVVPDGSSYAFTIFAGTFDSLVWYELR